MTGLVELDEGELEVLERFFALARGSAVTPRLAAWSDVGLAEVRAELRRRRTLLRELDADLPDVELVDRDAPWPDDAPEGS